MSIAIKPLYTFDAVVEREVDETNTRVEDGKTITETKKVKQKVTLPFMFKKPSRAETEEAKMYRSIWFNKCVERGIMPEVILLKTYANYDGILSNEQKKLWHELQAALMSAERDLRQAEIDHKDDKEKLDKATLDFVVARQNAIDFQQEQAAFFDNTAEAKSREKVVDWLFVNLSYYKPDVDKEWQPFFRGATVEEKLDAYEEMADRNDELLIQVETMLRLLATVFASSSGPFPREEIDALVAQSQPEAKV